MKTHWLLPAIFLLPYSCFSQQIRADSTKVNSLSPVVVTGQFEPQSIQKSVFNVRVISGKDIKQLAANNLGDVLNQYLNINIRPGGNDGRSTVSLFGLDGQYFKILIDNIPVVSDSGLGNNIDLTQINLDNIERIEIIEGAMGVTHGSNAVSGVLNIITKKKALNSWEISALTQEETVGKEYALFQKGRHIQGLDIRHNLSGNWSLLAGVNRNDFTGFVGDKRGKDYSVNDTFRGYTWLPKEQWTANTTLAYRKDNFRFFLKSEFLDETVDFYSQTVTSVVNPPFDEIRSANDNRFLTTRFYNNANFSGKTDSGLLYNASVSYQKQKREKEDFQYNINDGTESGIVKNTDQSSEVLYSTGTLSNFFTDKKADLQIGYEAVNDNGFSRVEAENNFIKDVRKNIGNYDVFASAEINTSDKFSIRPGARYSFQTLFKNQYAASLGFRYLLKNNTELRASAGKSYRTPNFEELYSQIIFSGHYFIGNPNLVPENGTSAEGSIKKDFSFKNEAKISSSFTAGFLDLKDKIDMALIEIAPIAKSQYINISKYQMVNFAETNRFAFKNFNATAGISFVGISQEVNNGQAVSDDKFLYTFNANASVSYEFPKWSTVFAIYYKYNGRQQQFAGTFDDAGNPVFRVSTVSAFSWIDASLRKSFYRKRIDLTLGARNIANVTNVQQTQFSSGAAHPASNNVLLGYGRSYFLKLEYHFNF